MAVPLSILQIYKLTPFPIQAGIQIVVVRQQVARSISADRFILTMTNTGAKLEVANKEEALETSSETCLKKNKNPFMFP